MRMTMQGENGHVRLMLGENCHTRLLCVVQGTTQHTHPQSHPVPTGGGCKVRMPLQGDFVWWRGQIDIKIPKVTLHPHEVYMR